MIDKTISPLRQRMIEDMTIRHFKEKVQKDYIRHVRNFTVFLGRSPTSWSAVVRLETPDKESPSRVLPTATLPSWAGLLTARRRGLYPEQWCLTQRAASSSAPGDRKRRLRLHCRAVRRRQNGTAPLPPRCLGCKTRRCNQSHALHRDHFEGRCKQAL